MGRGEGGGQGEAGSWGSIGCEGSFLVQYSQVAAVRSVGRVPLVVPMGGVALLSDVYTLRTRK